MSDKIRTYNYPQARVTDHRINYTVYNLTEIVSGSFFFYRKLDCGKCRKNEDR